MLWLVTLDYGRYVFVHRADITRSAVLRCGRLQLRYGLLNACVGCRTLRGFNVPDGSFGYRLRYRGSPVGPYTCPCGSRTVAILHYLVVDLVRAGPHARFTPDARTLTPQLPRATPHASHADTFPTVARWLYPRFCVAAGTCRLDGLFP